MAKDQDPLEALTATAAQTAQQITKQTQGAMESYFGWLQKAMSTYGAERSNTSARDEARQRQSDPYDFVYDAHSQP